MTLVTTVDALDALYPAPGAEATVKVTDHLPPDYIALIAASPFAVLATAGPEGLDCSPRGDRPGFVRVVDSRTLAFPDQRGNNRVDSLRNIVRDPRVALLFLIPGSGTTFRVNGRAVVSVDPDLLASFAAGGREPRTVVVITIEQAYFQCGRSVARSQLWFERADPRLVPTPGTMLWTLSAGRVGGAAYDAQWPDRASALAW